MRKIKSITLIAVVLALSLMLIVPSASAKQVWQNSPATEYDGLGANIINNCVLFARYKVPSLPYGLVSYDSKKNICNSNTAIAGEIAVLPQYYGGYYGHVAYVESVDGSTITILEGGAGTGHINRRRGTASELEIYGYFNPGGLSAPAPAPVQNTYTGYVIGTDGSLVINSKPAAGNGIAEIPEGGAVTVDPNRTSGNWLWVTYNGVSGYSYGKYISRNKPEPQPAPAPVNNAGSSSNTWTGYVRGTDGSLVINSQPKVGYDIGYIPEGAAVTVYPDQQSGNWYWVSYNGISGYSYSAYIVNSAPAAPSNNTRTGVVRGTDGSLVINSQPKAGYDIGYIPEGAAVTVYPDKQSGNWYWVTYNGVSGYSYGKYIILQ